MKTEVEHILGKLCIAKESHDDVDKIDIPYVLKSIERASTFSPFRSIDIAHIDTANFQPSSIDLIFNRPELSPEISSMNNAMIEQLRIVFKQHLSAGQWWTFAEDAMPPNVPYWWINPALQPVSVSHVTCKSNCVSDLIFSEIKCRGR